MQELGLELVPGDREDLAKGRRLGRTWVALPKAARPGCTGLFTSEGICLALQRPHKGR